MNWKTIYLIVISCIAFQGLIRDLIKLRSKLKERSGQEERIASLALVKKRAAGDYVDEDE